MATVATIVAVVTACNEEEKNNSKSWLYYKLCVQIPDIHTSPRRRIQGCSCIHL